MTSEWVDITEELAFDCAQLKLGQLVHEPGFSLHEAMTAIEIMHPQVQFCLLKSSKVLLKMDIGVKRTQTRVIHDVKSAAALGLIPWDNCSYSELISIFDTQFGALLCWLNGQNLAQTVYACHHIHAID